jgi:flagellar basal body rod protein FlgG
MSDSTAQVSASLDALTREFDIIAHNMANVSTAGFKRRCNSFTQALEAQSGQSGQGEPPHLFDFSQGNLVPTGRTLDLALHGNGFFVLESPAGPPYTSPGPSRPTPNGQVVDAAGRLLAGVAGPLIVPSTVDPSDIRVNDQGVVSTQGTPIGELRIVDFPDQMDQLMPAGGNCFRVPEEIRPTDITDATVRQGFKESSNVRLVDEMVNMILVSRMYEANMKFVNGKREATRSAMAVAMG